MFTYRPAEITGSINDFYYYHSLDLKNGESVEGDWDLRNRFSDYTGGIDLTSKSVVDVGTASVFWHLKQRKLLLVVLLLICHRMANGMLCLMQRMI
jgi:hypothetical protein